VGFRVDLCGGQLCWQGLLGVCDIRAYHAAWRMIISVSLLICWKPCPSEIAEYAVAGVNIVVEGQSPYMLYVPEDIVMHRCV